MLNDATCFKQVYIVCGYTNLRSRIDTMASIIDAKTDNSPFVPDTLYLLFRKIKEWFCEEDVSYDVVCKAILPYFKKNMGYDINDLN